MNHIHISSIDHLVLVVQDIAKTCEFYQRVLGLKAVEEPINRWSLKFGHHKISLQQEGNVPSIAQQTLRGTANFCLLTQTPMESIIQQLKESQVQILEASVQKQGAVDFHPLSLFL
ncbi:MAG: VOC family protein [Deinococcales bacterium]